MNRTLTREQLKEARAIRVAVEKQYPEWHYLAIREETKKRWGDSGENIFSLRDEDIRLVELSSKEYADYWRKAVKPAADAQWRRQYACFALMGLLAQGRAETYGTDNDNTPTLFAETAFRYADAMLAEEAAGNGDATETPDGAPE